MESQDGVELTEVEYKLEGIVETHQENEDQALAEKSDHDLEQKPHT